MGEWQGGFARFLGSCSAYIIELWGVLDFELRFRAIEFHIDSKVIVQNILDSEQVV